MCGAWWQSIDGRKGTHTSVPYHDAVLERTDAGDVVSLIHDEEISVLQSMVLCNYFSVYRFALVRATGHSHGECEVWPEPIRTFGCSCDPFSMLLVISKTARCFATGSVLLHDLVRPVLRNEWDGKAERNTIH